MKGWKTWTGAVVLGLAATLEALGGEYGEWAKAVMMAGGALGLVGVGHKLDKAGK